MPRTVPQSLSEIDLDEHRTAPMDLGKAGLSGANRIHREGSVRSRTLLFVTNSDGFGGTEKHLIEFIRRLVGSGIQPFILAIGADVYSDHLKGSEPLHIGVQSEGIRNSPWDWLRLFRKTRPDIVVFVNSWVRSFPWYASVAAFLAGVPRRFAIQHLIAPPLPKVEGNSVRSVLRRLFGGRRRTRLVSSLSAFFFNTTICVSNAVRDRLVTDYSFPANRTITIYNGVSISEFVPCESNRVVFRARRGFAPEDFVLVCVARLSEVKGLDTLLLAMPQLLRQGLSCKCIIVGDGPLRKVLSEQAQALGLHGAVFFEGFQKDVRPFLQAADAFVLTSRIEGFPLSIVEAMACGLPCVVTDVGGNAEAIHHMVHGLIIASQSADAVADAISYLITHPRERAEMSKMVRARAREAFDVEDRMAEIRRVILS
jgi:glycosyltransferase involved in cell wall biosynthesis